MRYRLAHRIATAAFAAGVIAVLAIALFTLSALAAQQVITSAGPLTNIYLNDDLACQANHVGDTSDEFYGGSDPGACGTFIYTGGMVYGATVPAGNELTPYGLVSQTAVTGSGTSGDQYKVVTVVDVGETGLSITQTDSYVIGDEFYRTDIVVSNSTDSNIAAALYHAADCYLQNSDSGYGFHDSAGGGIYCSANADNSPAARIEGFVPITSGSNYVESTYFTTWSDINGTQFPNTCDCTNDEDNGAGLSWDITVPAQGSVTRSLLTAFSPTGQLPPTSTPSPTPTSTPTAPPTPTPTPTPVDAVQVDCGDNRGTLQNADGATVYLDPDFGHAGDGFTGYISGAQADVNNDQEVQVIWDWGLASQEVVGQGTIPQDTSDGSSSGFVPANATPGTHTVRVCWLNASGETWWYQDLTYDVLAPASTTQRPTPSTTTTPSPTPTVAGVTASPTHSPTPTPTPTPQPVTDSPAPTFFHPTATPTPTPTPTPEPTLIPPETVTPAPTFSPTPTSPSTGTPAATASPPPVPTASPGPTLGPSTASPTPTPVAISAAATPAARVLVIPTPTAVHSASPTPTPRPTATPSPRPSPSPTVLSASRAPQGSGSPGSITTGSGGNGGLPEFAQSVLTPDGLSTSVAGIGINVALAGFTLLLLMLSSELFNKTVEENHDTLSRWLKPVFGPIESLVRFIGDSWNSTAGESAFGMIGGPLAVLALSGLIYGVLEPGFGFNNKSIVMFLSVIITVGLITYFYNGGQIILSKRLFSMDGAIRLFPVGVLFAALSVLLSRIDGFQPGIIYGFIASAVLLAETEPNKEQTGKIIFYPVLGLLGLCVLAWFLISPLREFANDNGGWWAALPATIAVGVFVGGLEGTFFQMIPLRYLDGHKIWSWNKLAWVLVAGAAAFMFWDVLLRDQSSKMSTVSHGRPAVAIVAMVLCLVLSLGFYAFFRLRGPEEALETVEA